MARPRNEERGALLLAARSITQMRLAMPLPAVTEGEWLVGATALEMSHKAQVGWDQALKTIANMVAAGELVKLGRHRPEWCDRSVWVYGVATQMPRWAEPNKEALDALAAVSGQWGQAAPPAPDDVPTEQVPLLELSG